MADLPLVDELQRGEEATDLQGRKILTPRSKNAAAAVTDRKSGGFLVDQYGRTQVVLVDANGNDVSLGGSSLTFQDEAVDLTQRAKVNFTGTAVTAADNSGAARTDVTINAVTTVEDEGTPVVQRANVNFVGTGVSVADAGGKTVVTIPGGSGYTTVQDEGVGLTARSTINFTGAGVTASDVGGVTTVSISGAGVSDATASVKGVVQLAGDLGGTAAAPTVPNLISKATVDAKGDLLAGTADNTVGRLAAGTDGQFLQAASAQASGLQWATITYPPARSTPTFGISGTVANGTLPGFFVSIPSGRTKKLLKMRYAVGAGSCSIVVRKGGTAITGFGSAGAIAVSTTATTTDPSDVSLAEDDYIDLVISSASGCSDLRVTLVLEEA